MPVRAAREARPWCSGVILAGGANTRFQGRRKGLERVGARTIVERVAGALRGAADELWLVANDAEAASWIPDARVAADVRTERGSLVGIHTALARTGRAVLVVAWDMPFVPATLLRALRKAGEADECTAVPAGPHGLEPLCAYYPLSALPIATRQLEAGEMKMSAFIDALPRVARLEAAALDVFGDPSRLFFNVNDAASLARAREIASAEDSATSG